MKKKSKGIAYALWFFLGLFGGHRFYLGQVGMGLLMLFTGGLFGVLWLIDLFTLSKKVDDYNFRYSRGYGNYNNNQNTNNNNIVVNVVNSDNKEGKDV
jgi:TM2 domain-containing membrane protein YozV